MRLKNDDGFPGDTVIKNLPVSAGDTGLVPGSWRYTGVGKATHSSILAWNSMDRGAWWATAHGATRSETELSMHAKNDDSLPQNRLLALSLLTVQFMFKHGSLLCFLNFCGFSLSFHFQVGDKPLFLKPTVLFIYVCKSLCSQICIIWYLLLYLYFNPYCMVISSFFFISWRLITLQYCSGFCHTLTWIRHI